MLEKITSQFRGSQTYVLDDELAKIVNISIALEMPLLLKGEPVSYTHLTLPTTPYV